ncbi:hypothetical protein XA68_12240 [Ophiocordyceps unilateralis]|uniref:DUF726 domain-containing protein n=1 Tax=Ophiocordyceps unilateralis TaxID=268505 RepID=A0A2A9PDW1_OPHUN|nr:hypothetical protein XA68_12240 [Ophiocordyceps unilateralis]
MAPLCADPRQVVIALDVTQRLSLLQLVQDITSYMISQLEAPTDQLGPVSPGEENDGVGGGTGPSLDAQQQKLTSIEKPTQEASTGKVAQETSSDKPPQEAATNNPPHKPSIGRAAQDAKSIQLAAMDNLRQWRDEFLPRLRDIAEVKDSSAIEAERQARREKLKKEDAETTESSSPEDVTQLQSLYRPMPTPLTELPPQDRREALTCTLLLLLATGKYSAHSRALMLYLASALALPPTFVNEQEGEIAKSLMESSNADGKENMSAEAEAAKRQEENKLSRYWKVGLASVAGAAVIGVTGGLAAPLVAGAISGIMGGVGLGGVASFLGIFWANGALVGALFGAYGAKMTGEMMDNYAKEVEDFRFIPLDQDQQQTDQPSEKTDKGQQQAKAEQRRLRVTIGINGWLSSESDIQKPWLVLGADSEAFALRYELKTLLGLGSALNDLVHSLAWKTVKRELVKRTALATLLAALWPVQILAAASTSIDNPFQRARHRSRKAGRLLADALVNRVQGERPVALVGYSLGASAIHACLQELADRRAFGLVDSVVLIGAPAPAASDHWRALRPVVSGTIFNVYSENDLVLGLVYRLHALDYGVAGLQPVHGVPALRNVDFSAHVTGHLRYPLLTADILRRCGFLPPQVVNTQQAGGESP